MNQDFSLKTYNTQQDSPHFHSPAKGCEVENKSFLTKSRFGKVRILGGKFCNTHRKDLCRCGWEWGWHYGTKIN